MFTSELFFSSQGFSKAMSGFLKLGLIQSEASPVLHPSAPPVSWVRSSSGRLPPRSPVCFAALPLEASDCMSGFAEESYCCQQLIEAAASRRFLTLMRRVLSVETQTHSCVFRNQTGLKIPNHSTENNNSYFKDLIQRKNREEMKTRMSARRQTRS